MQTRGNSHGNGRQKQSAQPASRKPKQHQQDKGREKVGPDGSGSGKKQPR